MKGYHDITDEEIGIKDHKEMDMGTAMCCDQLYHGGQRAAEYTKEQENKLAQNIRKHRAP
jgi:hypothetical protein